MSKNIREIGEKTKNSRRDLINILVEDPKYQQKKEFQVYRDILKQETPYFEKYLQNEKYEVKI